jgi:hypothetical protein
MGWSPNSVHKIERYPEEGSIATSKVVRLTDQDFARMEATWRVMRK